MTLIFPCSFKLSATTTVTGLSLPKYIQKINITFPLLEILEVMPVDNPTVPVAEQTSYSKSKNEN